MLRATVPLALVLRCSISAEYTILCLFWGEITQLSAQAELQARSCDSSCNLVFIPGVLFSRDNDALLRAMTLVSTIVQTCLLGTKAL